VAIAVDNALNYRQVTESRARLAEEKRYLQDEIRTAHNFDEIIGSSAALTHDVTFSHGEVRHSTPAIMTAC
jgi:formate hydrogenlyase transcriptional activator